MLRIFAERGSEFFMKDWEAQRYRPGRGFHITRAGRQAWHEFQQTSIVRQNPDAPLTRYFDAEAYGLSPQKQHREHVMPLSRTA